MSDLWELPTTWCWTKMGDATDVIGGGTPRTTNPKNFEGSIPWITPADMSGYSKKTISGGSRCISEQGLEESGARWLPEGTVLFSSRAPIGYVAIASQPVTTNQGFKSFVPGAGLSSDYLYYWLSSSKRHAEGLASGTTFLELSGAKATLIPLPLAPVAEQTRIVEKLEELLSGLDAGVAELKAAQKKLAQYRQSLLKAAVEGALTAKWREEQRVQHTAVETGPQLLERILAERRARWEAKQLVKFEEQGKTPPKDWQKKYPEPVQLDSTDLPELPEGWVWATIDQLAAIGTGVTPLKSKSQYYLNGDIPWVTSGALNNEIVTEATEYVTPLALTDCRLELYPAGALLVAMYGEGKTRGKCSELAIPTTINQAIAALVLDGSALSCKPYLKSFLLKSYDDMRNQASGGVQPNLNLQIVRSITAPIPPLDEQRAITDILSAELEAAKDQGTAIDISLKQSAAQRQNILRAAFAGQLVPQDPNDEPASVLLARIRAERAELDAVKKPRGRKTKEIA